MGNLFYRRVSPTEIENMDFKDLKYWNSWHETLIKEEKKATEAIKGGRK